MLASGHNLTSEKAGTAEAEMKRRNTLLSGDGVGEIEDFGEFGLGVAPREAKPSTKIELSKEKEEEIARMNEFEQEEDVEVEMIQQQEE